MKAKQTKVSTWKGYAVQIGKPGKHKLYLAIQEQTLMNHAPRPFRYKHEAQRFKAKIGHSDCKVVPITITWRNRK